MTHREMVLPEKNAGRNLQAEYQQPEYQLETELLIVTYGRYFAGPIVMRNKQQRHPCPCPGFLETDKDRHQTNSSRVDR